MPRKQITYSSYPNHAARAAHAKGEKQFKTYDTSSIRPKHSHVPAIVSAVVAVALLVVIGWFLSSHLPGCSSNGDIDGTQVSVANTVDVTIPSGATLSEIAEVLANVGVVPDEATFVAYAKSLGLQDKLQAGTYTFSAGMTLDDVTRALATGATGGMSVTIPEGYTVAQAAAALESASNGRIGAEAFLKQAKASNYQAKYAFLEDAADDSLEGFLFPKTYRITESDTADTMIVKMLDQYASETAALDYSYAAEQGLSAYDVLILASIVEREALPTEDSPDERENVASVFYNRLAIDMPLQSDATMGYVTGGAVSAADLEQESPYNTYLNAGLTPTPICNPGLASLAAVCSPNQTDYLYFFLLEDEDHSIHAFSENLDEHQAAIDRANAS